MIKVINDGERPWVVRLVFEGDKFGLDFQLVHSGPPLLEFYDARYESTPFGQFVSRYFVTTLVNGGARRAAEGLQLDGSSIDRCISSEALSRVLAWADEVMREREQESAIRLWYVRGDMSDGTDCDLLVRARTREAALELWASYYEIEPEDVAHSLKWTGTVPLPNAQKAISWGEVLPMSESAEAL